MRFLPSAAARVRRCPPGGKQPEGAGGRVKLIHLIAIGKSLRASEGRDAGDIGPRARGFGHRSNEQ